MRGLTIPKQKLVLIAAVLGGLAALAGLVVAFGLALAPRPQAKIDDYLAYSLEGLDKIPDDKIFYRESDPVKVPAEELRGLCLLPNGGLAVSGDNNVFIFDARRELVRTIPVSGPVFALAAADTSPVVLYLGMRDHLETCGLDGGGRDEWTSLGEKALIFSVALVPGRVLAADSGSKNIACFDRGGKLLRFIALTDPKCDPECAGFLVPGLNFDLAAGPCGALWAVDPGRHRVLKLAPDGAVLSAWGKAEPSFAGFVGCCNPANIAVFPDGSFVTQEKGLLRIKLYDAAGRFTGFVAGPASFHESLAFLDLAAGPDYAVYAVDTYQKTVRVFVKKGGGR